MLPRTVPKRATVRDQANAAIRAKLHFMQDRQALPAFTDDQAREICRERGWRVRYRRGHFGGWWIVDDADGRNLSRGRRPANAVATAIRLAALRTA